MSFDIILTPVFEKELKKIAAKYPSFKSDFQQFIDLLSTHPTQGVALGNNCYKIRLSIAGKGRGKSGGARVITHVKIVDKKVFLVSVYDKSSKENITPKEISARINAFLKH